MSATNKHSLTHTHLAGPETEQHGVECAKSTGFDPQCALVQTGLFSVSRNPIYVADAMVLMGWAAWLASGSALLVLPVFVGYITIMQIRAEEQALSAVFGDDYHAYCQRVRRWV